MKNKEFTKHTKNKVSDAFIPNEKYIAFFNYAPISLWLEDFSKAKEHLDNLTQNLNISTEQFLTENPEVIVKLASLVTIKDVNYKTLELYKASSKSELFQNLNSVFTEESSIGFSNLLVQLLTGKKAVDIITVNKNLKGEKIDVKISFNALSEKNHSLENVVVSIEDITDQLEVKRTLEQSKNRYKEAQNIAKLGVWEFDFKTKKLYWSEEVYNMIEVPKNIEISGLEYYLSFVHIEDRNKVQDFSIEHFLNNPIQQLNYRIITQNGEVKHISEKRSAIINNEGRIDKIIGIGQDVTDRIKAENTLNKTQNLMSNTLSGIDDGLVILDNNFNYTYANKKACQILKKESEYLIGKNIWAEFPEKKGDLFYDKFNEALKSGKTVSFENYFKPWGKWFSNRIIPSKEGVLLFFQEITKKKEHENEIKKAYNIINNSASVAILCKVKYNFPLDFASENIEDLFGYKYNDFIEEKVFLQDCIHPKDIKEFTNKLIELAKSRTLKGFTAKPFRVICKNGNLKWIKSKVTAIRNSNGKTTHLQGIVEDITELKKADDLLKESNQRLVDQFNNTPLASIMWDLNYNVIEWNNSAEKMFGYKFEEAVGKNAKDLIIPKYLIKEIEPVLKNILNQTGGNTNTNENITKNGNTITCDWYNVTLKNAEGKVIGVASLVDDITEKNKAKEALQKSEAKYRDLFEKSHDPIMTASIDGTFANCNEATLKLFDCNHKNEIIGKSINDFSPKFQPGGESSKNACKKNINTVLEKGTYKTVYYHKNKKDKIFPCEVILTKIIDHDSSIKIHGVIRDISERVKKERLEKVIYNIANAALTIKDFKKFGLFIKNELHKIIDTNNFYIALYNEDNDTISTPFIVDEYNFDATDYPAKGTLTGHVIKTKKPLKLNLQDHLDIIKSGKGELDMVGSVSKIWVGVPLKKQHKVFGAIAVQSYKDENAYSEDDVYLLEFVANQISSSIQIKNSQAELEKAMLKAQQSDKLKSAFLANMSHEIRTPMNGIIGFSELFLNKNISESKRQSYANIVIKSSKQLLSIVNDILDISKIEAGVIQLNTEDVNINELLDDIYSFYKPKSIEKNINFNLHKSLTNNKSIITTDRTKLKQVFDNLLSNSFKFTNKGEISFGYTIKNNFIEFYVKDTGIGIQKELQPKIFDRFIQATTKNQQKGTGLGLAISKKFIELFGGKITLKSNKNGTNIYFTVPYSQKPINKTTIDTIKSIDIKSVKNKELTILVAEDEEYNMMYINELFSSTNFKIIEANNGEIAVEIAKNNPTIDIILMDIKMPKLNGYEAMKIIKKERPNLPIVALSAFAMESDKETAIGKGFNSYLTKPINKNLLFDIINKFTN